MIYITKMDIHTYMYIQNLQQYSRQLSHEITAMRTPEAL